MDIIKLNLEFKRALTKIKGMTSLITVMENLKIMLIHFFEALKFQLTKLLHGKITKLLLSGRPLFFGKDDIPSKY